MQDKVSIVCVTYNAVNDIEKCLQSIISQSYPDIEIVIMDGGSTDGTIDILEKYNDKIAYWRSEPDKGIYDAMNKAVEHVTGKWVYFIGADDELYPEFSDFVVRELKDSNTVYYANVMFKGKKVKGETSSYQQLKAGLFHQSIIYPASVFKKYTYDLKYKISADHDLNLKLHGDKQYKIEYRDYVIAFFNHTGVSAQWDEPFVKDMARKGLKYFGWRIYLRYQLRRFKYLFKRKKNK